MVFVVARDIANFGNMGKICLYFHLKSLEKILLSSKMHTYAQILQPLSHYTLSYINHN